MKTTGASPIRFLAFTIHFIILVEVALAVQQSLTTVAPPTPEPHKDPGKPERGQYQLTGTNGSVCLMAHMGLQLNITFTSSSNKTVRSVVNLEPNGTQASGSCEMDEAILQLSADAIKTNLTFLFTRNVTTNKYFVSEISLSADWPEMKEPFSARNSSLKYLGATLGYSYMCHEEQTLAVVEALSINAFQVQLQPFNITRNQFSTALQCQLDQDDMLIAIVVGAALAGLVLIVLVAYLIGRRRSHAGYQTI
ncbi:lysosome-associated membrane glycoprotein 1-like isoform X1 [Stigmatopora nigra]